MEPRENFTSRSLNKDGGFFVLNMYNKKNGNLKIVIQKEGRLTEGTLSLLHQIGLDFETYKQRQKLFSPCYNFPLEILYVRDDDIPNYVQTGVADLGIVGRNLLLEKKSSVKEILPLGFGNCTLMVAVHKDSKVQDVKDLNHARVATSYPRVAHKFFKSKGIHVRIINISGSVEITPTIGIADAIVDLVSTGSSLLLNDLRPIVPIFESQAVIIANKMSLKDQYKSANIERLINRFKGVLAAKKYKYVMMNVPEHALKDLRNLTPGLKSPTVMPLMEKGWFAVHTVLEEETFWEVIERMKKVGAQGILVSNIEKMIA